MSMIEYEIEQLENIKEELDNNLELDCDINNLRNDWIKVIDSAIDTIKTQSEKLHAYAMERSSQYYHDGWIPCSEKLPDYGNYLGTMNNEDVQEVTYCDTSERWTTCEADGVKRLNDNDVIAWMPLPEPYKGE